MSTVDVLAGYRVLEVDGSIAARYCGRLLAQLGAQVIACRPAPLDDRRLAVTPDAGVAYGRWLDAGKTVVTDAPASPVDLAIGETPDASTAVRLSWFGDAGPYETWRGTDELVHALNGVASLFGTAEGPPTLPQGHAPQLLAGVTAANLALAALLQPADRRARRLDVDVLEASLCHTEVAAVTSLSNPRRRSPRLGVNRIVPTYPCANYEADDGWIGVTCLTPPQWRAFCELVDRPDLGADQRMATALGRLRNADEIDAAVAPVIRTRPAAAWAAEGRARRVPIVEVPHPGDLPSVDHWMERGAFAPIAGAPAHVQGPTLPFVVGAGDGTTTATATATGGTPDQPLLGVRVVDFTMGWAGPLATRTLADLGAEIVKVESATHPDWYRGWEGLDPGDPPTTELQPNFNTLNRNKLGVTIDLTTPDGLATAERLLATADVVIENYATGVLERLGLGHARHRQVRPGIVSVSMPAFGSTGPLRDVRAYGSTVEQASGLPFVNGEAGWPPSLQHVAYGDAVAGIYAVTAVLVGLHARRVRGGVDVDLAQVPCLFDLAADGIIGEQVLGRPLPRTGNARRGRDCRVVAAGDGDQWLAVVVDEDDQAARRALAGVVGGDELEAWATRLGAAEAARRLQAAGVPAAPVVAPHDLGADPHLQASGIFGELDRRYVGRHPVGASPFRIDGRRPALGPPAPLLGEHTAQVLDGRARTSSSSTSTPSSSGAG
jgi:crotonobetainyl-CoA:carnitine CoA-transferase CaiB-like acyl-CoA transferase